MQHMLVPRKVPFTIQETAPRNKTPGTVFKSYQVVQTHQPEYQ